MMECTISANFFLMANCRGLFSDTLRTVLLDNDASLPLVEVMVRQVAFSLNAS